MTTPRYLRNMESWLTRVGEQVETLKSAQPVQLASVSAELMAAPIIGHADLGDLGDGKAATDGAALAPDLGRGISEVDRDGWSTVGPGGRISSQPSGTNLWWAAGMVNAGAVRLGAPPSGISEGLGRVGARVVSGVEMNVTRSVIPAGAAEVLLLCINNLFLFLFR